LADLLKDWKFKAWTVEFVELFFSSDSEDLGVNCDCKAMKLVFFCEPNGPESGLPVDWDVHLEQPEAWAVGLADVWKWGCRE
jgi:hypothetical protein